MNCLFCNSVLSMRLTKNINVLEFECNNFQHELLITANINTYIDDNISNNNRGLTYIAHLDFSASPGHFYPNNLYNIVTHKNYQFNKWYTRIVTISNDEMHFTTIISGIENNLEYGNYDSCEKFLKRILNLKGFL